MNYNAYDELMSYFQFEFNVYRILFIIILFGLIKALMAYIKSRKLDKFKELDNKGRKYDLVISLLALIGLYNAMFFQGVIADIPLESGYVWVNKTFYLAIASHLVFCLQVLFLVLTDMKIRKTKEL